ncbi:MAG: histidine phosphatase family protein [Aminipila sp.]
MEIIIGGAYQGKLDYVKQVYDINEEDIFYCNKDMEEPIIDFTKKVIYRLEEFSLLCVKKGIEAKEYLQENLEQLKDKVIVCTDISQGIVPMEKEKRDWREMNGRTMIYLSGEADKVTRVFCGIPQVVKECKKKSGSYIHLIRHGTTEGNIKRWYYGSSDIPLTEEGKELVSNLVTEGIYPKIKSGKFFTSGLLRTEQTFNIIFGDIEHNVIENLKEMCFGDYEKHSYEDLKDKEDYIIWISDESGNTAPPGGESPTAFRTRVLEGFKELIGAHRVSELSVRHSGDECHSAVVCHGGVISAIMAECFPEEGKNFFEWIPDPGHGYTIEIEDGSAVRYSKI